MLSKNKLKYIKSLQIKKNRKENGLFLVEGAKSVLELIQSDFQVTSIYVTEEFLQSYKHQIPQELKNLEVVTVKDLEQAGTFSSNDAALAIARQKENTSFPINKNDYVIMLDDVRDPGNLGTIIRTADWYGIKKIICSESTAEFYNPKVISSTMGSFTRVQIYYTNLEEYLSKNTGLPVYGTLLEGQSIYKIDFAEGGVILMGNESAGIHHELFKFINQKITIPKFGEAESLNVGIATAIVCDNIRRSQSGMK